MNGRVIVAGLFVVAAVVPFIAALSGRIGGWFATRRRQPKRGHSYIAPPIPPQERAAHRCHVLDDLAVAAAVGATPSPVKEITVPVVSDAVIDACLARLFPPLPAAQQSPTEEA